ncbi:protein AF-10 isoform X2 [Hermetia illucens]|uniref:protein AF-10 isoform X2 n=1 Tax=Hermetia illucens TaxID=343691 RepID=UPI0018CBFBF6|nr:protein AF-10 isoform X2 [Hermetia illucens]
MKEMVGGCCVCSDERGWPENPLVYCDGQNCTVAVHQACYGIVTVPTGPWYCRKCESQERSARVRCELCPSRDGALKKTDNQGWAHVVCALYIPEVRFGNVTTMEPIILQLIPPERYAKTCYICQEIGKGNRATVGACMQCNKSGCKQQFHVTCAQGLGLLCEEAGNYLDNVKYCGYCQHHYSKLKKGGNVKTIPPYKPVTHESASSDGTLSPEKEIDPAPTVSASVTVSLKSNSSQSGSSSTLNSSSSSSSSSKQRKSGSNKLTGSSSSSSTSNNAGGSLGGSSSGANIAPSSSTSGSSKSISSSSGSSKDKDKHSKSLNKISSSSKNQDKESSSSSTSSSTRDKSKSSKSNKDSSLNIDHGSASASAVSSATISASNLSIGVNQSLSNKDNLGQKFTTHNFTESVVMNSESVFGGNNDKQPSSSPSTGSTNPSSSSTSSNRDSKSSSSSSGGGSGSSGKKRKADSSKLSSSSSSNNLNSASSTDALDLNKDIIKDVSVTLIPLPMNKRQDVGGNEGSSEKISISKKPKTDTSNSSPHHDVSSQGISQNLSGGQVPSGSISIKQAISQVNSGISSIQPSSGNVNSSASSTSIQSHIKPAILKDIADSRNRSSSPYNSSAANPSGSGTPSLYVSVPLSNANVPGINLPSASANDHVTQTSRSSPLVNHSHHQSNSTLSQPSVIERQSPRILQNQSLHLADHTTSNSILPSSASLHHTSNMSPTLNPRSDPSAMDTSGLKIAYEKQKFRSTPIQDQDQLPARRSRSQSGDSSGKSSRSGKKRSAAGSSTTTSTSTSSTSSPASMPSTSAALPTGSNTEGSESANAAPVAPSGNSKNQPQSNKYNNNSNNSSDASSSVNNIKGSNSSSAVLDTLPPTANNSSAPPNMKQMNKKMLRAQQSQQQQPPHHSTPPPQLQIPQVQPQQHSAAAPSCSTASITSTTTLIQSEENNPSNSTSSSNSRTPDNVNLSTLTSSTAASTTPLGGGSSSTKDSGGGLKFIYESQTGSGPMSNQSISPSPLPMDPVVKDSPPSSPGSEAGSSRKRGRKSAESKDNMKMFFQNGVHATHMLGNQLNPASSVAQKMSDQLHMEIEAHSIYTQSNDAGPQLIGVPLPGKGSTRNSSQSAGTNSLSSMLSGSNSNTTTGNTPQSLEQLLERQWEQGSQFLMEQAQHFDIASLLSCLHQLRTENVRLEEHVNNLIARRDHLLAVNARLAIPLNPTVPPNATLNNMHMNGPSNDTVSSRLSRVSAHYNAQQQQQQQPNLPVENGIDFRHSSHPASSNNPSSISRHSSANLNYSSSTSSVHNQQQSQHSVLSSPASSSTSSNNRQQQQPHQQQQPPLPHPHSQHQQLSNVAGASSSSGAPSMNAQSMADAHSLIRGSGSGRGASGSSSILNSSSNNSTMGGGLVGTGIGVGSGGGGGGGGNIGSSSYHNATQQSAAYSTVHQSQLRRDDSHAKPS